MNEFCNSEKPKFLMKRSNPEHSGSNTWKTWYMSEYSAVHSQRTQLDGEAFLTLGEHSTMNDCEPKAAWSENSLKSGWNQDSIVAMASRLLINVRFGYPFDDDPVPLKINFVFQLIYAKLSEANLIVLCAGEIYQSLITRKTWHQRHDLQSHTHQNFDVSQDQPARFS